VTARRYEPVVGILDPPVRPADRAELVNLLRGTEKILVSVTTPVGGAYRRQLVARIKAVLRAEPAGDPLRPAARDAVVLEAHAQCAAFSEVLLAPWSAPADARPRR
jgi:hypothetical protein